MSFKREILVVEDNVINREILSGFLSEKYQVWQAENGQVALDILRDRKDTISLILLDVMMPVMDGYTFLDRLWEDAELSLIPVIVTTQGNSEEDELAALEHGATDFVPKPYRPEIILHRVAGLIKLRETAAMINQIQYDRLTGLYTKEFFYQKVRQALAEDPEGEYCIVSSNIENFKLINDVFGMREGDRLLQSIAQTTKQQVGSSGFCGRFGADRFLSFQKSEQERIDRQRFDSISNQDGPAYMKNVKMRWGIYEIVDRSVPVEHMCDRAMLAAESIRNQYQRHFAVYDDSIRSKLLREQAITTAMDAALREEQFQIYLQPKYDLSANCMCGAEALVRWIHPEWGFMSPGEFIPLFEKNGFIPKLDHYVREKVCIQFRKWMDAGYPLLPISVNISRADVFQGDLTESIYELTRKYGVDPVYLHLEITESVYAENTEQLINTVDALREKGFILEMDDFGSGYSSLNMLSQMSLDILKLDMKFIQNEIAKPEDRSFLRDIVSMAHRAELGVVAEGVETREQMNRLKEVGCDYAQGYFFAKPMPIAEYEELLKKWEKPGNNTCNPERQRNTALKDSILIVDTDIEYRQKVRESFGKSYQVLETENEQEALACLQSSERNCIVAVIVSMTLPEDSALHLVRTMRQIPAFVDIPVLVTVPSSFCGKKVPLLTETDDFLCKKHPMHDLQRRIRRLIDISYYHRQECAVQNAPTCDSVTGLLNGRGFQGAVMDIRPEDMPIAMGAFVLDDRKEVDDTMLRSFAELLCNQTRVEDIKCYYGDKEFRIVMKQMKSADIALKRGEEICGAFRKQVEGAVCSGGIVLCEPGKENIREMIARAEQTMLKARREHRGSCCLWEEA